MVINFGAHAQSIALLSACLSVYMFVRSSVRPSVCLSVCLSVGRSVCLSVCLCVCLYIKTFDPNTGQNVDFDVSLAHPGSQNIIKRVSTKTIILLLPRQEKIRK